MGWRGVCQLWDVVHRRGAEIAEEARTHQRQRSELRIEICPETRLRLPAALHGHFAGEVDHYGLDQAAVVFLEHVDHVAVGAGVEEDTLVG